MTVIDSAAQKMALPQLDGILTLNKPAGCTSALCLKYLKRLGQKKIGHAGTLDPLAKGVLLVLLGQATKISSCLLEGGEKIYRGTLRLGIETDTWDIDGKILREQAVPEISALDLASLIKAWEGEQIQEVPPFSAAKHNGQPLYKLARAGRPIPEKVKKIIVHKAEMLNCSMPYVEFRISCSSGSYVRSLAHSLGKRVGSGAVLTELVREYSSPFGLNDAIDLHELQADPGLLLKHVHPIEDGLPDWARIQLTMREAALIRNGAPIAAAPYDSDKAILFENSTPLAIARRIGNQWRIQRGLWN